MKKSRRVTYTQRRHDAQGVVVAKQLRVENMHGTCDASWNPASNTWRRGRCNCCFRNRRPLRSTRPPHFHCGSNFCFPGCRYLLRGKETTATWQEGRDRSHQKSGMVLINKVHICRQPLDCWTGVKHNRAARPFIGCFAGGTTSTWDSLVTGVWAI